MSSTAWTTTRRGVLAAAGTVSLAAAVAACGGSDGGGGGYGDGGDQDSGESKAPEQDEDSGDGGGQDLGSAADIPEGGGKIFKEQKVVVTRPEGGSDVKAFSAVCTHKGCTVGSVSGGTINCPCHGSKFSIEDGSVKNGPATQPLPGAEVSVRGGKLQLDT